MHLPGILLLALLAILAFRTLALAIQVHQGRVPWTRLLIPAALLLEGAGLRFSQAPGFWRAAKVATALGLELGLLGLMAFQFLRLRAEPGVLPEDHLAKPLEAFLPPRISRLIAIEVVMLGSALRFLFGGWRRADPPGFSYHRSSAFAAILPVLPLLILGDLVLLEVLLRSLTLWIRLLVHALDAYGVLWILGLWASFKARPHRVQDGTLHVYKGLLARTSFPLAAIRSVGAFPSFDDDWARLRFQRGVLGFQAAGAPALYLELDQPVRALGLLGLSQAKTRVALSADDAAALTRAIAPGAP
jgi:hypothetical protein